MTGEKLYKVYQWRYDTSMRSRIALFAFLFITGLFTLPLVTHASGIPFFGPIIPSGNDLCPAGWGMLIIVVNNIIEFAITLVIVFIAPIMIAYSGFLFVVNPVNPSGKEKAKSILLNTVVGTIIALAGWLIVDAVMAVLYNPSAAGGTWSSIVTSGGLPACLQQAGSLYQLDQSTGANIQSINANGNMALSFGTGACDSNSVLINAQSAGYSLTMSQANTLACIAAPEDSCGSGDPYNYSWNKNAGKGKASTAFGAFQIALSTNHLCFENPVCYKAAGVTGPLNCQNGFGPNGFLNGGNATVLANCIKAASNLACNTAAAACVLQKQGFSAWTADPHSSLQAQCITKYSSS